MMFRVTFKDYIEYLLQTKKVNPIFSLQEIIENPFNLEYLEANVFELTGVNNMSFLEADETYNLFTAIYGRYSNEIIYFANTKFNDNEEHKLKTAQFMNKIYNIYTYKADKYLTLLKYYTVSRNKLLDGIKSRSSATNRFNDTPQVEGNFIAETYTTNITLAENEVTSDKDTLMIRLAEIQEHYKEVWNDFLNEFKRVFIVNMED